MGMIYRRKRKRPDGTVVEGETWWIKYYANGRAHRESSESPKKDDAKHLLRQREGDVARGVPHVPRTTQVRVEEIARDVVRDYRVNGKRSLADAERRIEKHLLPFFGTPRAVAITTADVQRYTEQRQAAKASAGEINRELSLLRRSFNLGKRAGKVAQPPYIPLLKEHNVRTGFFEPEKFEAVRSLLTPPLRALVTFLYITGWRTSEALGLQWQHVDLEAGWVGLDVGTTKNGAGRVFPFTDQLRALLEAQREHTRHVERERGMICPWVFHRHGKRIRAFRKAWKKACEASGCPARIVHDFRRTAVRHLVRRGIVESVAMKMTGHKTRSVFERYNIVSEGDLRDAAKKLNAPGTITGATAENAPLASTTSVG